MSGATKKGALIGCGFFATNHLNAWAQIEGVKIAAVCDIDPEKAKVTAQKFRINQVFFDAETMLNQIDVDFVDIATTPPSHLALVKLACDHGCGVICQKPIAESMAEATAMVEAAKIANTPLIIHENFRWQKGLLLLKEMVEEGDIGVPHFARFSFRHGFDNYKNQPYLAQLKRFSIMDVGLHLFDLARHFLGEVNYLTCHAQNLNPIVQGEDAFTAMLTHNTGATSLVDCSFYSKIHPEPFPHTLAWIEGSIGSLELGTDFSLKLHKNGRCKSINVEPSIPSWGEKPWHNVQDSVINFQQHCLNVFNKKCAPQPSGDDNLKTLALALAAYESTHCNSTIAMNDWLEGAK